MDLDLGLYCRTNANVSGRRVDRRAICLKIKFGSTALFFITEPIWVVE